MNEYYAARRDDELYHYGVKGMKWGIRRNARVLANHRRNQAVKKIKNDYERGKITAGEKKGRIQKANMAKKQYISDTRQTLRKTKDYNKVSSMHRSIANQTINEVPKHRLKKGLTTANRILEGYHTGINVAAGVAGAALAPGLAPLYLTTAAVAAASERGVHALIQMGIDRLS